MTRTIPTVDFTLAQSSNEDERRAFVQQVGDALHDIGFFALVNHGIDTELIMDAYAQCDCFFELDENTKRSYLLPEIAHQRGYTAFGVEHAKDNPAPDLKEFWQTGRGYPNDGPTPTYPQNVWPNDTLQRFVASLTASTPTWKNCQKNCLKHVLFTLACRKIGFPKWLTKGIPSCE